MSIMVAFIGAGSVGFTRKLVTDLLTVPELRDTRFGFTDISRRNLDMVAQLCRRDIEANGLPATIEATTDRRRALEGADYVINCTRIGGLEAFRLDVEIPLRYGVDQCVGDTLAPGGIFYGQRNVPQLLAFCRDIREVARPGALLLNYANPMAINTWACLDHGGVPTVGLCHGVEGGWWQIAMALGADPKRWREEVEVVCAGINHQTWYVPWYRKRPAEIRRWIDLSSWINGETGGYLRVCTEGRNWFETDFPKWLAEAGKPIDPARRSREHGSYIIEAIETGRPYRGHFNLRNGGCIANLPADCVVEAPGYVDRFGVHLTPVGDLPLACAATCQASIDVQRMAKEAAVRGDVALLRQAVLHDPLTAAVCDPDEVWRMVDEMLVAEARWLPQYRGAIAAARRRVARAPRPPRAGWKGAARLRTRTVAELRRKAAAREVLAADKAAAKREEQAARARRRLSAP